MTAASAALRTAALILAMLVLPSSAPAAPHRHPVCVPVEIEGIPVVICGRDVRQR